MLVFRRTPYNVCNDKLTMLKIMEYMAYGVPVVLYDLLEGRRTAGDAALYAKGNDPIDFAQQIGKLLDSPSLRRELGMAGRRRVEESLNWQSEKKEFLRAYETVIEGTAAGGLASGASTS